MYYKNKKIEKETYYQCGNLHRLDGPAVIWYYENGSIKKEDFWVNGKEISKERLIELSVDIKNIPFSRSDMIKIKLTFG